jgi:hypothetical protein
LVGSYKNATFSELRLCLLVGFTSGPVPPVIVMGLDPADVDDPPDELDDEPLRTFTG